MLTVKQVAGMTRLTERQIQYECQSGRLKATITKRPIGRPGYTIAKIDYLEWLAGMSTWRRRWNRTRA